MSFEWNKAIQEMHKLEGSDAAGLSEVEHVAILQLMRQAKPRIEPFRSGGFMNKDYDMARISIDLPIIQAKKLMEALKAI